MTTVAGPAGLPGTARPATAPDARPERIADGAATAAPATLALTGRGAGVLAAFVALVVVSLATGSLGLVPLLVALGVVLLVAPGSAWGRGRRALARPAVHVVVHALPATVPIGGSCTLHVVLAATPGRRVPPLGLDPPGRRWRLSHRLPTAPPAAPAGTVRTGGVAARLRWHPAPGPLALLPLSPARTRTTSGVDGPGRDIPAASLTLAVPTGRRGILRLPALRVWTHDPFGLFAVTVAATAPLAVVVHPLSSTPPDGGPSTSGDSPAGRQTSGPVEPWWALGGSGDFTDLRPYVPGDRLHLLDWPALARYDALLVRRFDPEVVAATRLVLDDRAGVHRRAAFEALLSSLLGLVERSADQGRPVEFSTLSGLRCTIPPTSEGLVAFLPVLATLDPRRAPASVVGAEPTGGSDVRRSVTVLTTATGAERLPAALRQGAQVVVAG